MQYSKKVKKLYWYKLQKMLFKAKDPFIFLNWEFLIICYYIVPSAATGYRKSERFVSILRSFEPVFTLWGNCRNLACRTHKKNLEMLCNLGKMGRWAKNYPHETKKADRNTDRHKTRKMVGVEGFELSTFTPPVWRANQAALYPELFIIYTIWAENQIVLL